MGASDMAISPDGAFYLRTGTMVGRYNPETWREIPFDYGEERHTKWNYNAKGAFLKSGLRLPSTKTSPHWHHGGMDVNAHGDILVTCFNPNGTRMKLRKGRQDKMKEKAKGLETVFFPGRLGFGRELHVWDERGRVKSIRYYFRMHVGRDRVPEAPGGGRGGKELDDSAEQCWACYAWPVEEGSARAFYCDQTGAVMQSADYRLTGSDQCPVAGTWMPCD